MESRDLKYTFIVGAEEAKNGAVCRCARYDGGSSGRCV